MTLEELYQLLTLPAPVIDCLRTNAQETAHCLDSEAKQLYLNRATTTQGLEAFQRYLGEDSDGMRLLSVLLQMACETWEGYRTRGINKEIFTDTMKFVSRFCIPTTSSMASMLSFGDGGSGASWRCRNTAWGRWSTNW